MEAFLKILLLLLLFPYSSHAIFQKIYNGYKVSNRLKAILIDEEILAQDFKYGENKYDWKLELGGKYSDSSLQSIYSFQSQQTISESLSIGLTKNSYKYGAVSINHSETDYDLSNWASGSLGALTSDKVYESKNTISYSYEFLNRSKPLEWDLLVTENSHDKILTNLTIQKDYLDFFEAYNSAKLRIVLDGLYKDFGKRAKKRVKLVSKRVIDGLSRKYELNQSRLSLLSQEETIIRNKSILREKVIAIEDIIGINIPETEYKKLYWSYKPKSNFPFIFETGSYLELRRLEKLNEMTTLSITKLDEQINHSLSLSLSYSKNAVNENKIEAFSDSGGTGKNNEKIVSLMYSFPLGLSKKDSVKQKLLLQKNKSILSQKNLKGQLEVQVRVLKENLVRYEKAISILKKKVSIANNSVKEHQKLYIRGQVSFEEMLRAEETYINSKISQMNMYSLYDMSLAQLAYISGNIIKFLNMYTD